MTETAIRETAAPWYIRQSECDGIAIVLVDASLDPAWDHVTRYFVLAGGLPWGKCGGYRGSPCQHQHVPARTLMEHPVGNILEEAEAAYAELERQLLAGKLNPRHKGDER